MPAKSTSYGIASMVLGILSLVFSVIFPLAILLGILAIVFGIKQKRIKGNGFATTGLITGVVGILLSIFVVVAIILLAKLAYYGNPELI
jgi:hypothetical protein